MTMPSLYQLRGVKRTFRDGKVILDIDELDVPDRTLVAVVGPNGAGKSTLLRILAFLEGPDQGTILFRGKEIRPGQRSLVRRQVTMVDQSPFLFHGTVFKNVAYGLKVRGIPRSEWEHRVAEALRLVDLAGFEHRPAKGLSGGEAQRVALARALVFRPEVILLDEPTASVDAARVEMLEALIMEVNAGTGASIVFSTHNLAQAHRLTDHVIHLSAGKIVHRGLENLFSGRVIQEDGTSFAQLRSGIKIAVPNGHTGTIRFTIPSSHIRLVPVSPDRAGPNRIEGRVTRMEIRGAKVRLRLSGEINLRVEVAPRQVESLGLRLGDRAVAVVPPEAVEVLDEPTGT